MQQSDKIIRVQRNILIGLFMIMFVSNLLLAVKINHQENIVILVPTIDRELRVGSNFVSNDYLKLRAEQIINLFFSMKEETLNYATDKLLKQVDETKHLEFKEQLEKLSRDIKTRGYRYIFTDIHKFEIDNESMEVAVEGYLETYLADRQIDKKYKKYLLIFNNRSGIVKLISFMEVIKNEKAD